MTRQRRFILLIMLGLFSVSSLADVVGMTVMSLNADPSSMNSMEVRKEMGECGDCFSQTESCGFCNAGCVFHVAIGIGTMSRISPSSEMFVTGTSILFQSITGPPDPFPPSLYPTDLVSVSG